MRVSDPMIGGLLRAMVAPMPCKQIMIIGTAYRPAIQRQCFIGFIGLALLAIKESHPTSSHSAPRPCRMHRMAF